MQKQNIWLKVIRRIQLLFQKRSKGETVFGTRSLHVQSTFIEFYIDSHLLSMGLVQLNTKQWKLENSPWFWNSMIPAFSDILWVLTLICNVTRSWIRLVRVCGTLQGISTRYLRSCIPGERHCHRFAICLYTIMDRWNCSVEEDSAQFAWGGYPEYGHSWNCIAQGTSSSQHCEVCCYGVGWSLDFMM